MNNFFPTSFIFTIVLILNPLNGHCQLNSDFDFGNGINFKSTEGDFELKFQMRFQTLFTADFLADDFSTIETNTLIRRSRLKLSGKATERLKFKLEYGLSNRDFSSEIPESGNQANMILDAVLKYKLSNSLSLWFGQTKLPSNRERVISSQNMQQVDRSLLNRYFTLDRDIGFQLRNEHTLGNVILREYFALSQGEGRNITAGNFGGYDYTFHVEMLPFGEFSKKGDFLGSSVNFVKGETNADDGKLSVGLTYSFNNNTTRSRGQLGGFVFDTLGNYAMANMQTAFFDAIYKYKRFSFMNETAWRKSEAQDKFYDDDFYEGWSYNNMVGLMLNSKSEVSFRHTHVNGNQSGILDMYTFGFSRYVLKHALKFQTDFSITSNESGENALLFRFQTEVAF
jgi:hypothetical protein